VAVSECWFLSTRAPFQALKREYCQRLNWSKLTKANIHVALSIIT